LLRDKWHFSEKGFPVGKGRKWDGALLQELVSLVRKLVPAAVWEFDKRDVVNIRLSEGGRIWASLRTKESESLELKLIGPAGGFNLAQFSGIGSERRLKEGANGQSIHLSFQSPSDFPHNRVAEMLARHVEGFRAWE